MKKQLKQTKNINIIFDKKNICSYNISIATLEMLNNLLLLENLVSFDFPFSWLSAEGGYPTLYAASKMYDITAMPGNELTLWLQEVEKNISNLKRYQYILKKARDLFDENDYLEKKILDSIDKIARTQLVSNESDMTPEQYERLVRFTEDASMEEKQEILCKLEQSGDLTLDEQTLKEIMKIKDAVEKKREYGIL